MMTLDRFTAILDAYGAEPRRWPAEERDRASAFAHADPRGRALLAEARRLDATLDLDPAPTVRPELRARVLAAAPTPSQALSWAVAGWARLWAPRAGLVAAGLAGVMFGAVLGGGDSDGGAQALLAEAEPYDEAVLSEGGAS